MDDVLVSTYVNEAEMCVILNNNNSSTLKVTEKSVPENGFKQEQIWFLVAPVFSLSPCHGIVTTCERFV